MAGKVVIQPLKPPSFVFPTPGTVAGLWLDACLSCSPALASEAPALMTAVFIKHTLIFLRYLFEMIDFHSGRGRYRIKQCIPLFSVSNRTRYIYIYIQYISNLFGWGRAVALLSLAVMEEM